MKTKFIVIFLLITNISFAKTINYSEKEIKNCTFFYLNIDSLKAKPINARLAFKSEGATKIIDLNEQTKFLVKENDIRLSYFKKANNKYLLKNSLHRYSNLDIKKKQLSAGKINLKRKAENDKKNTYIILKFDDLKPSKSKCYKKNWQKLVNTLRRLDLKAALGIIPYRLKGATSSCKDSIKNWHKSSRFEIWHHGWNHKKNYGELKNNIGEFSGTPYSYQKENLEKAIELVKKELDITMTTFGAPYNKTDSIFSRVIRENKDIKIWLYAKDEKPYNGIKLLRGKKNKLESKTGVVSFDKFLKAYNASQAEYLVLQGHPGLWDANSFMEFEKTIQFQKNKGAIFMLPHEYYLKNNKK